MLFILEKHIWRVEECGGEEGNKVLSPLPLFTPPPPPPLYLSSSSLVPHLSPQVPDSIRSIQILLNSLCTCITVLLR